MCRNSDLMQIKLITDNQPKGCFPGSWWTSQALIQENVSAEPCLPGTDSRWHTSSNVLDTEIDLSYISPRSFQAVLKVSDKENRKAVERLNCTLSTSEIKMMH